MKKNYKILISIGFVLLLAVTAGVVFQVDKTNKTLAYDKQQAEIKLEQETLKKASDYASAINSIKDGNFPESRKSFEDLKGYKDADIILQYVRALEESKRKEPRYSLIESYYESIPIDYKGDLSKEINEFEILSKNKQDALVKQKEIASQQKLSDIVEHIKKGNYDQARSMSVVEYPVLYSYASGLENEKKGNHSMAIASWRDIPLDYSGLMSSEILKTVNTYSADIQKFNASIASYQAQKSMPQPPQPRIGMTANEVENSYWGKPSKVNRTTTAYGVSEQWVYSSGKYIYLKNGIVTAIQD